MPINILELYQQTVRILTEQERLELMALIAYDLAQTHPSDREEGKSGKKVSELFGSASLGYPTGMDNEQIDADLAREYAKSHEGSE